MIKNLDLICLLFISANLYCQTVCPTWEWAKKITNQYHSIESQKVITDDEGSLYYYGAFDFTISAVRIGPISFNPPYHSSFVCKLDSNGNWLWGRQIPHIQLRGGAIGPDNGLVLHGNLVYGATSIIGTDTLIGDSVAINMVLLKLDRNGNFKWGRHLREIEHINISVDGSSNILVAGKSKQSNVSLDSLNIQADGFVAKADSAGNWIWAKPAGNAAFNITSSGNNKSWVFGDFLGTATFDSIVLNVTSTSQTRYIGLIEANGNWSWVKKDTIDNFGINGTSFRDYTYDKNSACIISAQISHSGNVNSKYILAKIDQSGTWHWIVSLENFKPFGGWSSPNSISCDHQGNVYWVGRLPSDTTFFANDTIYRPFTRNVIGKLSSTGQFEWEGIPGIPATFLSDIAVHNPKNIYVLGEFKKSINIGFNKLEDTIINPPRRWSLPFMAKVTEENGVWLNINDTTINCGDSVRVLNLTNSVARLDYNWSPANNVSDSTAVSPLLFPTATTTYTVTGNTVNGCADTAHLTVTVNPYVSNPANTNFSSSTGMFRFCENGFTLSAPANYQSYNWNTGANTQSINPKGPGVYTLSATTARGCLLVDSVVIVPLGTISSGINHFYLCNQNDSLLLAATGGLDSLIWSTGEKSTALWVKQPGYYWTTFWDEGCKYTDSVLIKAFPNNSTADFSYQINGTTVEFKSLSTNISSYLWQFGDGWNEIIANPTHQYLVKKKYTVCLEIIDLCGGKDTVCKEIDLNLIGLNEHETSTLEVFPNPSHNYLHIKNLNCLSNPPIFIDIVNSAGQTLREFKNSGSDIQTLNIDRLTPGLYFLVVGNQRILFTKI